MMRLRIVEIYEALAAGLLGEAGVGRDGRDQDGPRWPAKTQHRPRSVPVPRHALVSGLVVMS